MTRELHSSPPGSPDRRRPSARRLEQALDGMTEGIIIAERRSGRPGFAVALVNPAFCAMTGFTAAEFVDANHRFAYHSVSDRTVLRRWHRRRTPGPPLTGEGYLTSKKGSRLYATWTFNAFADSDGRVTHIVGSYRNMTEKRELQDALVHAQRLDAVGRLAGRLAHDFNNLLSVIDGYCGILSATVAGNSQARKELAEIHQAARRASTLVRQLLDFGRRQPLNVRVLNLDRLLRDNAGILTRLLGPDKSLELCLRSGRANVRVDPHQLQQVLLNLTINARDALQPGGSVTISTARKAARGGARRRTDGVPFGRYVVLAVSDNGSGMDARTQAHLFEPYFTTKAEGEGSGLGLSLVHGVVEQSGGHIFVHTAAGAGTTFEILLPEVREPASPHPAALPPMPVMQSREHILLAESDDVVRKMAAGMLTADGYKVVAAPSLAAAMARAKDRSHPIDLVVVDDAHARESARLIASLQRSNPQLRVLRALDRPRKPLRGVDPHLQRLLPRPFALSTLLRTVRELLDVGSEPATTGGNALSS